MRSPVEVNAIGTSRRRAQSDERISEIAKPTATKEPVKPCSTSVVTTE
jgi:hypothetical protein